MSWKIVVDSDICPFKYHERSAVVRGDEDWCDRGDEPCTESTCPLKEKADEKG